MGIDEPTKRARKESDLRLSGQQETLHRVLSARYPELARMYLGAIMVLTARTNPEHLVMAGHSLRELMDKAPKYLDVSVKSISGHMKAKVGELATDWRKAESSSCCRAGSWKGDIDVVLRKFLAKTSSFFKWFDSHYPKIRDETAAVVRKLDASGRPLPQKLEQLNVSAWMKMRAYFIGVAKHEPSSVEEFMGWLDALERFLLDRLSPRTFQGTANIDGILKEARSDDKP